MDPKQRLVFMDQMGIDVSILYPSLTLLWESEVFDAKLCDAYCRAYNRWIVDFCRDSGDRLVPIAHVSLMDVELAIKELERTVRDGAKGVFIAPHCVTRKAPGHPDHFPFFAKAAELDVTVGLHPILEPSPPMAATHFDGMREELWYFVVTSGLAVQTAFTTLVQYGVFDAFPTLRVALLECSAGWVAHWIDRMDSKFGSAGYASRSKRLPSEIFRAQCWVSADPDETILPRVVPFVGEDRFLWASDYPHFEAPAQFMKKLEQMVLGMSDVARTNLLGASATNLYGIQTHARKRDG